MTWVAVGVGSAAVIGGAYLSADAAKDAAKQGQKGADAQLDFYRESRDIDAANNRGYLETGYNALNALNSMAGLPLVNGPPESSYGAPTQGQTLDSIIPYRQGDSYQNAPTSLDNDWNINWYNRFLADGELQNITKKYGDGSKADWGDIDQSLRKWRDKNNYGFKDKHFYDIQTMLHANKGSWDELAERNRQLSPNEIAAQEKANIPNADYQWQKDPGYLFRMAEGSKALDSRLAAGGSFLSGASIKAATQYNQNFATNEFSNVFSRLSTLAGYGPSAAAASNNPNYVIGGGNAIGANGYYGASGQVAQGNAWANGINQIGAGVGNYMGSKQTPSTYNGGGGASYDKYYGTDIF